MKTTKSYGIRIVGSGRKTFQETIDCYRSAVAYLIGMINTEWSAVSACDSGQDKVMLVDHLVHSTGGRTCHHKDGTEYTVGNNVAKYDFDSKFPNFPSYFRRCAIQAAVGAVSSYKEHRALWIAGGCKGKAPKLTMDRSVAPAFYKKIMSQEIDPDTCTMRIKLLRNGVWGWHTIQLAKTDVRYIQTHMKYFKDASPVLEKRYGRYEIRIAFENNQKLWPEEELLEHPVCAVDLGRNSDAVCVIMLADGTVIARKFLDFAVEKDRLHTILGRISRHQRKFGPKSTKGLWRYAVRINKDLADKTASAIVDFATLWGCSVIVFEHLDFKGRKPRGKKQMLAMWRHGDVQERTEYKAHWNAMRLRRVCPWGTSRYAFDGSGPVTRDPKNRALATFRNGEQYNADLSAAYNIGARFFIRELTKPLAVTLRSTLQVKIPALGRRTSCTLADLKQLYREMQSINTVQEAQKNA